MLLNEATKLEVYVLWGSDEAGNSDMQILARRIFTYFDLPTDPKMPVDAFSYVLSAILLAFLLLPACYVMRRYVQCLQARYENIILVAETTEFFTDLERDERKAILKTTDLFEHLIDDVHETTDEAKERVLK